MPLSQKLIFLRRRLINFAGRALRWLGFFPFTLLYIMLNAAIGAFQWRRGHIIFRVGEMTGNGTTLLPRSVTLWLDRALNGPAGYQYYVCLRLPCEAADANLHEVFSVLLTSSRLRSVGLYWDAAGLADDLSLLQVKQDPDDQAVRATSYEDLGSPGVKQFEEFLQGDHAGIDLPVAAIRDAQTLLKRVAKGAHAVCLNVPVELRVLANALVAARSDVWFFDLSPELSATEAANNQVLSNYGLNLHERMAVVQSADAYVGSFDELGCAALIARRPAVLLGGGNGAQPDRISRGDRSLWFPDPSEPGTLTKSALQFLSDHLRLSGK